LRATKPKISVLILTFNQAQFIHRALQSVVEQRSSNYDLEIIVTDDGSSDGTVHVIERFAENSPVPIRVLVKTHQGVTAIANNLLSMINLSDGDFIAFLAGDDSFSKNRFCSQMKKFEANPDLKISYSNGINCIAGELGQRCHSIQTVGLMSSGVAERVHKHLTSQAPVLFIQGVLAKADFLRKIQPFDVDLIADDWIFNIKVFDALVRDGGDFDFEPSVCFIRNIHGDNTSRDLIVHYERVRQVAERYCSNARKIKSKFISNGILSSVQRRDKKTIFFFIKKAVFYPEALILLTRNVIAIGRRKLRHV